MTKSNEEKIIGNFKIGKVIGTGTFGKVREGTHIPTGQKVAIKMLQKKKIKTSKDIQRIQKELQILKDINHPNILKLLEVKETDKFIFIVTELVQGEQLYDRIVRKGSLPIDEACKYFCQLLQAVKFLHSKKVAHRDIKPENIIVDGDNLKLIDFGLSTQWTQSKTLMQTPCGSPCYAAPEMVLGKRYDCRKVDVWAMGVTLYAMLVGKLPFQHENTLKLYRMIESSQFEDVKGVPTYVNLLLHAMIEKDSKKRITIPQMQDNIWLRDTLSPSKPHQPPSTSPYNTTIITEMSTLFNLPPSTITSSLTSNKISQLSTYYHLRYTKENKRHSLSEDEVHDGPFHVGFVFRSFQLLEAFLEKSGVGYEWVGCPVGGRVNGGKQPELNCESRLIQNGQNKKYILINNEVLTVKKLKNLPKLIYLPIKNIPLKTEKQNVKIPMFDLNKERSHTHLDSSRSSVMDNLCVETF